MSRLGWPRTSDGDPIYPRPRRVAASRAVTGQKVADRQQSCIRLRPFFHFGFLVSPSPPKGYSILRYFVSLLKDSDSGLDLHRPGTLPSHPRQRAALVVPVPCHAVIRALAPPFPGPTLPAMKFLVTGCDMLRIGPESMTGQRLHLAYSFLSDV